VLINNAGLLTDHRQTSVDGFELTFAVNVLAPFLLTTRLLDTLKRKCAGTRRECRLDGHGWRRDRFFRICNSSVASTAGRPTPTAS
jgi:NAD(P)-dependent dehydrogenase (short-subunit alcohol dehydrogenase family)